MPSRPARKPATAPAAAVIGVGSSTQSTKATVIDAATGRLLAVGRAPHTVTGQGGARESDPEEWWQALRTAVAAALADSGLDPGAVIGIAAGTRLLGLDREDAVPGGETVLLPFLDGERTPDLPAASGPPHGLRHDMTRQQILGAAYEGAVVAVLRALDELPLDAPDAPLRLIGGGARGAMWVETVRRLSGRPLVVPDAVELVALGAAALAAGAATGRDPVTLATEWGTGRGRELPAVPRDTATWNRVTSVLDRATPGLLAAHP